MHYLVVLLLVFLSCTSQPDLEKERESILQLQARQRQHHFEKNTEAFIAQHSDDFISVSGGAVQQPARDSMFRMFDAYFRSVKFVRWDDKQPPVVRFSDDATVAYVAVEKLVVLEGSGTGNTSRDTSHYAWISVYKKINGAWKLDAIASTNR